MGSIFLIGYMGSGKTTLGKILASRLEMPFVDLDIFIEQHHFKTIARIFEEKGENEFRNIERAALKEVSQFENSIISTGGGVPCFFDNMDVMNSKGLTVYLCLTPEELVENLRNGKAKRPLIKDKNDKELLLFIRENLSRRNQFYNRAKLVINPNDDIEYIVKQIFNAKNEVL